MRLFGLLGYPLGHSFSPLFINQLARRHSWDLCYRAFEMEEKNLAHFFDAVRLLPISGLNVTTPYKQKVLRFCDNMSDDVQSLGAANTLVYKDGSLIAYNTDVFGFVDGLLRNGISSEQVCERPILILGAGGAARAAFRALWQQGARKFYIAFRSSGRIKEWQRDFSSEWEEGEIDGLNHTNSELQKVVPKVGLIVQTTPVGMWPHSDQSPEFPFEQLSDDHLVYDLVYNPPQTLFMQQARKSGARALNGLWMLASQAAKSLEHWGYEALVDEIYSILVRKIESNSQEIG